MAKKATIKTLAANECACYSTRQNDIADHCCAEPNESCRCVFFVAGVEGETPARCRYFEESVLPLDRDAQNEYWSKR